MPQYELYKTQANTVVIKKVSKPTKKMLGKKSQVFFYETNIDLIDFIKEEKDKAIKNKRIAKTHIVFQLNNLGEKEVGGFIDKIDKLLKEKINEQQQVAEQKEPKKKTGEPPQKQKMQAQKAKVPLLEKKQQQKERKKEVREPEQKQERQAQEAKTSLQEIEPKQKILSLQQREAPEDQKEHAIQKTVLGSGLLSLAVQDIIEKGKEGNEELKTAHSIYNKIMEFYQQGHISSSDILLTFNMIVYAKYGTTKEIDKLKHELAEKIDDWAKSLSKNLVEEFEFRGGTDPADIFGETYQYLKNLEPEQLKETLITILYTGMEDMLSGWRSVLKIHDPVTQNDAMLSFFDDALDSPKPFSNCVGGIGRWLPPLPLSEHIINWLSGQSNNRIIESASNSSKYNLDLLSPSDGKTVNYNQFLIGLEQDGSLTYRVKSPEGKSVNGTITAKELATVLGEKQYKEFCATVTKQTLPDSIRKFLDDGILKITFARGHTRLSDRERVRDQLISHATRYLEDKGQEYSLVLMSDEKPSKKEGLNPHHLYVKQNENDSLIYKVINPEGKERGNTISNEELKKQLQGRYDEFSIALKSHNFPTAI